MSIKEHVTSLELSKRLKELGIKQVSLFRYAYHATTELLTLKLSDQSYHENDISAFLASELGDFLPHNLPECYLNMNKNHKNSWLIAYVISENLPPKIAIIGETLVDAMGKMLIHIVENELMEIPK